MNVGMLWFDNDPKSSLDFKIQKAARYYQDKYGKNPTVCFVHPSMLANYEIKASETQREAVDIKEKKYFAECGLEIRPNRSVQPHHFWVGVNNILLP